MILGIGVDSVEIIRFSEWHTYSRTTLQRIFSEEEIEYCLQQENKSGERFAVRFAAREAFFKALCAALPDKKFSFLAVCRDIVISKVNGRPILFYNRSTILFANLNCVFHISMTHSVTTATTYVIIEKRSD